MEQTKYTRSPQGSERSPRLCPTGVDSTAGLQGQLRQLYQDLLTVIERDPEQEIMGIALPVVDCVLSTARARLAAAEATNAMTEAMVDLISPATIGDGTPIRALDTWLVVGQVLAALAASAELAGVPAEGGV